MKALLLVLKDLHPNRPDKANYLANHKKLGCGCGPSCQPLHVQYSSNGMSLTTLTTPRREHQGGGRLSAFWERGSLDLPSCGLRRGSNGGPAWPIFISTRFKTLARGQASRGGRHGAFSSTASLGWLARRRSDQGGVPHEVPMTQAMTTKGARRAPARAASPFPLWCKGGKHRREDQAKAPIAVQQDQDQSNGWKEVTMEPKTASPQGLWQAKTNFSQDKCTRCSPSNWPIVRALPAQIFGKRPRVFAYK